ncbi:MAG TPA: nucleotidyltransferase family protein [Baekduia sp.]|nr:nucleotidyltransferase family protein [Baekduia sp.]HMJ36202.1 nucleotidyltransferase family protein [Baekduia sp.]
MASTEGPRTAGLVLAAGSSRRLGRPKQLLPYRGRTLLDQVLDTARTCAFHQLLCALGGGAGDVREQVDLTGVEVVENLNYGSGCSSSIAVALAAVDPRTDVLVLLLGDQPGVRAATVATLLAGRGDSAFAVCRYADGRGHPFAFGRAAFGELAALHGDKAVWKLLDGDAAGVAEVPIAGPAPLDVDTWEDYAAVLAAEGATA